ncbi:MAG: alpha-rhamnosidase [Lachnospiraceae bacterium]|nr:alpha-rhamnosidase [Lachnospiraceae bacterium]
MSKPRWIWHYGDFEIYHSLLLHSRRQEKGTDYPAMWKTDSPYTLVDFFKDFETDHEETLCVTMLGKGYVLLDGQGHYRPGEVIKVTPGKHSIRIRVSNIDSFPCVFVESESAPSDESWTAWHLAGERVPAGGSPAIESKDQTPEVFPFAYERIHPIGTRAEGDGILYDFGKETFGCVLLTGADPEKSVSVYYGESETEALDKTDCILWETVTGESEYRLRTRAFRYLYITGAGEAEVAADYEYLPLEWKGSFSCDSELINKVWETAAYTLHLNSREFFLDGIKRDRWVWSGDAYQSYMIQNYLFFDKEIVKRTIIALRGKEPVERNINTILDYSFYWIISLYDYYQTFGDLEFVKLQYPKMKTLLDFTENSVDDNGFVTGGEGIWIFVDWSEMDKDGAICAEQMLHLQAIRVMAKVTELLYGHDGGYQKRADELKEKIDAFYWREEKGAYIDSYTSGRELVTRHANIFAIMYGIVDEKRTESIVKNVLMNDAVTQITTPYFKFFELDVLCKLGYLEAATERMENYWGGMIRLGATSIWEQFDPNEKGAEHYAMYSNKYGRSLCHAWGSGPVYLLGRYYLGVASTAPGYETYEVAPKLGGLQKVSGKVPVNGGIVSVAFDGETVTVSADKDGGVLKIWGKEYAIEAGKELCVTKEA